MEKLSMCRVCLAEDIRLVPIVGTHLQEMYESLVLMPFETEDGRPILVCYICRARLKNCYEFRKICLQSEELFSEMLNCNKSEQVKLSRIYNEKRFYVKNVIRLSTVHVLGMDADSVGEALKCDVKDEPYDGEVISENVLEGNGVSDDVLPADSDTKNEESMAHVLDMDADSVGVETLFMSCDVKDEQSDPEDVSEDILEESSASDDVPSADSHNNFITTVKEEQIGYRTSDLTPKEPTQDVQWSSKDSTSSNLNKHVFVQDTFKKIHKVTAADITDHNKERPTSVQYTCDTCQQIYSSQCELERHVRLCSDVWQKDFSLENTTNAHTHTALKPHQCTVCNKQFLKKGYLFRHMRTHTVKKPYHCDICMKQFSLKESLKIHMRTHTGEKPHHCDICKKQFTQKGHLNEHMRTHTGEKPHHCATCKKKFTRKCDLTKHMRTHTGNKPHHCDICKKQFSENSSLIKHMRTHTGEKPFHCDICKKRFSENSSLIKHMRTHTGEKPFNCDICKKRFSEKSNLARHIMCKHSGEKLYYCNICNKHFLKNGYLNRHMRTHTGKKPYYSNIQGLS